MYNQEMQILFHLLCIIKRMLHVVFSSKNWNELIHPPGTLDVFVFINVEENALNCPATPV